MVAKYYKLPKDAGRYHKYLLEEATRVDAGFVVRAYGSGARYLGIHGREMTPTEFGHLAAGLAPNGKTKLGRSHRFRQWGFEMLFSAPSRVSMALQVLDERHARLLITAVEKAVHDAMAFVERNAAYTRVTSNGVKGRERIGLVYFVFVHAANRNATPEPNIHVHVVALSRGRTANGTWAAIENSHVLNAQTPARRVFNHAMAHHIRHDLGLQVVRTKNAVGIKGIDAAWAKTERRQEIKREQMRSGRTDQKGATKAALDTRKPKEQRTSGKPQRANLNDPVRAAKATRDTRKPKQKVPFIELCRRWRAKANAAGRFAADLCKRAVKVCSEAIGQRRADRCYRLAAKYLRENATSFTAHKVDEIAALFATTRNVAPEYLAKSAEKFRADPAKFGLVQSGEHLGEQVFTSANRMSHEQKLYGELERLSAKKRGGLSDRRLVRALAGDERATRPELLRAQTLVAAKGVVAGASTARYDPALELAASAYQRNRVPVVAIASTREGAMRLENRLHVQSYTAAQFVERRIPPGHWHCIKTGLLRGRGNPHERMGLAEQIRRSRLELSRGCVVVAEMNRNDVMEMRAIAKAVKQAKGKLILTGQDSLSVRAGMERHARGERFGPAFQANAQTRNRQEQERTSQVQRRRRTP